METMEAFGAVGFVLLLLGAVLFALRKKGIASFAPAFSSAFPRQTSSKQMQLVERVMLGPQHSLHLVRVGDVECLVTTAPGVCQVHPMPVRQVQ